MMRPAIVAAVLVALAAPPAPAAAAEAAIALDSWIVALRCRERPTFDARMACYLAAARQAEAPVLFAVFNAPAGAKTARRT